MKILLFFAVTADAQETNEIDEIVDGMVANLNVPKFAITKGKEIVKKIAKFVKDADRKINYLYAEIARQTEGQIQMSRKMRIDFSRVKSNLRQSRTEVRVLAQETVSRAQTILILFDHEDELVEEEVRAAIETLKNLLVRTKAILTNARTQYKLAVDGLNKMKDDLNNKVAELDGLIRAEQNSYDEGATISRALTYAACAGATIGSLIADAMGCVGEFFLEPIYSFHVVLHIKEILQMDNWGPLRSLEVP